MLLSRGRLFIDSKNHAKKQTERQEKSAENTGAVKVLLVEDTNTEASRYSAEVSHNGLTPCYCPVYPMRNYRLL